MVALDLALACLGDEDPAAAAVLFGELASAHGFAEAWTGLAAAALQLGEPARAAAAMQVALSRNTTAAILFPLAAAVAAAAGYAGWCALMPNGRLQADRPATWYWTA